MDATGARFMAGHLDSVNDHEEISGNQLWNLREFARNDLQVLMELGFSEVLKNNEEETISVNWESGKIKGNKDTIQNIVNTFEDGIYSGIITLSEKPGMQKLYFNTQGHDAILGYIQRQLSLKKILQNNYFFKGEADRTNQDILKFEVFCKSSKDLTVTKEVLNDTFCSFHLEEFSGDVKSEIENWKRRGKLVEVEENDGVTLTCTSDVKPKILQIHEQIIQRTCVISSLQLKYLVKHKNLLEGISDSIGVKIEIAPEKCGLELEGKYEQMKAAEREIRLQLVTESVSLVSQQLDLPEQLQSCLDTIAKEHGCEWELTKDNIHQTERNLQNCEYIATWHSPGRPGTFTVIEGETHDLNVDCLILLSTDTLFPVQIKPDESMVRAIAAKMQSRGQHYDIGDCTFLQDPGRSQCYKECCHLVIANSNPSEPQRNKNFYGISSRFKELFQKANSLEWKTVCMPAWIDKEFLSMDNIVKGYLEAAIDFQERGTALQFYLYCEKEKDVLREPLLTCIQKCYKKKNGFSRKIYRHRDFNYKVLKTRQEPKIEVKIDSIENMKTDVIVNTTSKDLNLSMGAVSKRLLSLAGEELLKECQNNYPNGIQRGEIAVTGTYELGKKNKCTSYIFHGALPKFKREKYVQNIKRFVRCCLSEADRRNCKSIAFPALGTGSLGYPGREVAKAMFDAVEDYRHEAINPCVKRVVFSLYVKDKDVCEIFMREEQKRQAIASIKQKKWTLPHFQEVQKNVGLLKGTLTRETDVVEIIVGVTSDIDPLGTNVVEIVINPSQDGEIQWKYSDENPQSNNDRLIVSYRESEPTMSMSLLRKNSEKRFKDAINSAISNCVDNNIAEIAFYFESGIGSDIADQKKITIIADVIDNCLLMKQTNGGGQKAQNVLHKVYIRLVDVLLFEKVRDELLKSKWTGKAGNLLKSVVQFGADLKWELTDPAVKARIEVVGESAENVHKVKQNIELELFRTAEIDRNNGSIDPTKPDFDVDSQHDSTNYNRDLGARPKTKQNMASNRTTPRDDDLGMRNKNSKVGVGIQEKESLDQILDTPVSATVNEGFIIFKERYNDLDQWKKLVKDRFNIEWSRESTEENECIDRVSGTYKQIMDFRRYLDEIFPDDPPFVENTEVQSYTGSDLEKEDQIHPTISMEENENESLNVDNDHYNLEGSFVIPCDELQSLLLIAEIGQMRIREVSGIRYDKTQSGVVVTHKNKGTENLKGELESIQTSLVRTEIKLHELNETAKADDAVKSVNGNDGMKACFIPTDDTILVIGTNEEIANSAKLIILKYIGREETEMTDNIRQTADVRHTRTADKNENDLPKPDSKYKDTGGNMKKRDAQTEKAMVSKNKEIMEPRAPPVPARSSSTVKLNQFIQVKIYERNVNDIEADFLVLPYSKQPLQLTEKIILAAGDDVRLELNHAVPNSRSRGRSKCCDTSSGCLRNFRRFIHMSVDGDGDITGKSLQYALTDALFRANELGGASMGKSVAILLTGMADGYNINHAEQFFDAILSFARTDKISLSEVHLVSDQEWRINLTYETFTSMSPKKIKTVNGGFFFPKVTREKALHSFFEVPSEIAEVPCPMYELCFKVGSKKVTVVIDKDDIATSDTVGIVCAQNTDMSCPGELVTRMFELCGDEYRKMLEVEKQRSHNVGEVFTIPTAGGNIHAKYIIHVFLPDKKTGDTETYVSELHKAVLEILGESEKLKLSDLAIPFLQLDDGFDHNDDTLVDACCKGMYRGVSDFLMNRQHCSLDKLLIRVQNHQIVEKLKAQFDCEEQVSFV